MSVDKKKGNGIQQAGNTFLNFLFPRTKAALTKGADEIIKKQQLRPNAKGNLKQAIKNAGESTYDLAKTTIPAGIELGLLSSPSLKGIPIIKEMGLQALLGALYGATDPTKMTGKERVKKTIESAALTSLLSGAIRGSAKALQKTKSKIIPALPKKSGTELTLDLFHGEGGKKASVVNVMKGREVFGEAQYFTSDPNYAKLFGNVTKKTITLKKPLVIGNQNDLSYFLIEAIKNNKSLGEWAKMKGFDSIYDKLDDTVAKFF